VNKSDIYVRVAPENIDMLTKIVEAYEYLGVVSTLDKKEGRVIIRGTVDTKSEILEILKTLSFPVELIAE